MHKKSDVLQTDKERDLVVFCPCDSSEEYYKCFTFFKNLDAVWLCLPRHTLHSQQPLWTHAAKVFQHSSISMHTYVVYLDHHFGLFLAHSILLKFYSPIYLTKPHFSIEVSVGRWARSRYLHSETCSNLSLFVLHVREVLRLASFCMQTVLFPVFLKTGRMEELF